MVFFCQLPSFNKPFFMSARSYHDHNTSSYPPSVTSSTTTTRSTLYHTMVSFLANPILCAGDNDQWLSPGSYRHIACNQPQAAFATSPTARGEVYHHVVASCHLKIHDQHEQHECRSSGQNIWCVHCVYPFGPFRTRVTVHSNMSTARCFS